jgi:hypothetical protein
MCSRRGSERGGAVSRLSSGERDKIVLAHPLQDQKYR